LKHLLLILLVAFPLSAQKKWLTKDIYTAEALAITLADSARASDADTTQLYVKGLTIPDASGDSANVQLFVWVCKQGSTALIDSVKRGTEKLTALVDTLVNSNTVVALYTYDGPSAGTADIITYQDNVAVKAFAVAYYNVASIGTRQYAEQNYAQSVSDDVSSQADDLVLVFFGYKPDTQFGATDGDMTTLAEEAGSTGYTSWIVSTAPGAETVSYTYTLGGTPTQYGEMAVVGLYLRP